LCCNGGALPQGAPTSPVISNSILYDFDLTTANYCDARDLKYTRYADDITVSGADRQEVALALNNIGMRLRERGLSLNAEKTRIASFVGQQRVMGVVVNSVAAPSRSYRRRARAIFDQVKKTPQNNIGRIAELAGIVGFLKMFPKLTESREVQSYDAILRELKDVRRAMEGAVT
jgi:retron-type reverse transcriptase